jgi:Spy/CpxP family protein refolding chaperone
MKSNLLIRKMALTVACATAFGVVVAPAQDAPRRPQAGAGAGAGAALFSDPTLTDEQRQALRAAFEPDREQTIELYRKLARARKELQDATFAEKSDPESIRGKGAELGKVEAELAVLRAKTIDKVRSKLNAEQLEKLKNNPMLGGGLGGVMTQGMQRPAQSQGDETRRQAERVKEYYRRSDQSEAPRRPAAPPPEEKP